MSFRIFLVTLFVLSRSAVSQPEYQVKFYDQRIDHYSFLNVNNNTFKQRYIVSVKNWRPDGPIFLYIGDNNDIISSSKGADILWETSAKHGALVIFVEHRYYGDSLPFGEYSFDDISKLGYLTVEQVLADISRIIFNLKQKQDAKNCPVILFGRGYGGMLAAWHRFKYPHLTVGALASSAPLLVEHISCEHFSEAVSKVYESYSKECSDSIRNAFVAIEQMIENDKQKNFLARSFRKCPKSSNNIAYELKETLIKLATNDYSVETNIVQKLPANPIKMICTFLKNSGVSKEDSIRRISQALVKLNINPNSNQCSDDSNNAKAWSFQRCTELKTAFCTSPEYIFPWDIQDQNCKQFNVSLENRRMRLRFGRTLDLYSNIVISFGERDPMTGRASKGRSSQHRSIMNIAGASQSEDLFKSSDKDSQALKEARKKEWSTIGGWLKAHYRNTNVPYKVEQV